MGFLGYGLILIPRTFVLIVVNRSSPFFVDMSVLATLAVYTICLPILFLEIS